MCVVSALLPLFVVARSFCHRETSSDISPAEDLQPNLCNSKGSFQCLLYETCCDFQNGDNGSLPEVRETAQAAAPSCTAIAVLGETSAVRPASRVLQTAVEGCVSGGSLGDGADAVLVEETSLLKETTRRESKSTATALWINSFWQNLRFSWCSEEEKEKSGRREGGEDGRGAWRREGTRNSAQREHEEESNAAKRKKKERKEEICGNCWRECRLVSTD